MRLAPSAIVDVAGLLRTPMTISEESMVIGPGGPGFRNTRQLALTAALVPIAFLELTVMVNVAESQGMAVSHVLTLAGVILAVVGSAPIPVPLIQTPPVAVDSRTTVHAPLEAATAVVTL